MLRAFGQPLHNMIQHCCNLLRWNVASVWPGLDIARGVVQSNLVAATAINIHKQVQGNSVFMLTATEKTITSASEYGLVVGGELTSRTCYMAALRI